MSEFSLRLAATKVQSEGRRLRGVGATTGVMLQKSANVPGHGPVHSMFFHDGCFDLALNADGFDMDLILGHDVRTRSWASVREGTMKVELDGRKLRWEAELPDERNTENLVMALSSGEFGGCSVGGVVREPFSVNRNEVLQVHNYDINGGDMSIVGSPANLATSVEVALAADPQNRAAIEAAIGVVLQKDASIVLDAVKSQQGTAPSGKDSEDSERILWAWRQRLLTEL